MFLVHNYSADFDKYLSGLPFSGTADRLYEPIRYILSLGGKRLRPTLLMMAYELYKDDISTVMPQATALEVYHNFTLLHDDLMDKSDMRRGKETVHNKWNDNVAILSGDAMLILAYRYLFQQLDPSCASAVQQLFTDTALEVCEGQQLDLEFEHRRDVKEAEYMTMIRLKTAVLLAASLKMGTLLAHASAADADALYNFGIGVGLAFQLRDDLLDVYGDPAVFGKKNGGDICANKKTYMLIKALEEADEATRLELNRWIDRKVFDPIQKVAAITAIYDQLKIREFCEIKMKMCYDQALSSLAAVSLPAAKKQDLLDFAEHLMFRTT